MRDSNASGSGARGERLQPAGQLCYSRLDRPQLRVDALGDRPLRLTGKTLDRELEFAG